ncbi:MAG: molybdopterin molybdotransferase MoeA [Desulfurococcales archaeon]|nr:molybdopterin molybdotransferase MoeA [Desulfurococcales archaeon]
MPGREKLRGFRSWENVDVARERLLSRIRIPLEVEEISIYEAAGRVLAVDVVAPADYPPYNRSAVDGYAVRSSDVTGASESNPIPLRVVGTVEAGTKPEGLKVNEGEAVLIFTGGELPEGADAVVPVEYVDVEGEYVYVYRSVAKFRNVSLRGEDFKARELLAKKGTMIRPWHVAALAQGGFKRVKVFRKLRVGIINTGDELYDVVLTQSGGGRIPNSSGPLIASYAEELGCEAEVLGIVGDDEVRIREILINALRDHDIIVVTGGTSVGGRDVVPEAISSIDGAELVFHGVNLRPGRTAGAFVVRGKPVLMLSGLPVACLVGLENFLKPVVEKVMGMEPLPRPKVKARLTRRVANAVGFRSHYRVAVFEERGELFAEPLRLTGSGILSTLLKGNGILILDESLEGVDKDEEVEVMLLGPIYKGRPAFLKW